MVLESIEDHLRGWNGSKQGLGGERVSPAKLAIEHVMPRKWQQHWPVQGIDEEDRDRLIHTLGNLTLLTGKLNSTVLTVLGQAQTASAWVLRVTTYLS
ncbi:MULTISPECIES: HNH endonuclease family protein [unclassified Bradyrhizobium]|uniref:HNH endonuclease family protein n=1 Tax=unclassified Bradyrhizobium TaxID=2631580 RepID=UPI001FFB6C5B|nr:MULTISPECIES: HNH endonuclease family protein [unclassified Bradyrhizobium]MCK1466655.1 HNH endonuclease [Bradyrhizobium sp. CW10]MCK1499214.1 HNH endonuclease [Bradyrhizobium sp. 188]